MKIIETKIESLIPYEFNNKIHDETQVNRIANSIKEFGFTIPILIDKNNVIIAGHGRLEGAKKLGLKTVPCIMRDDLTEKQIKKYRILDNKLNESAWNYENLNVELSELGNLNIGELKINIEEMFPDLNPDELSDDFTLPSGEKSNFGQITFTLSNEQKEIIEEAIAEIKKTDSFKAVMTYGNENSNGNALFCIIEQWKTSNQ